MAAEQMNETPDPRKSELPLRSDEVNPAVKSWLTNVLIPAMVQRYIMENDLGVKSTKTSQQDQQRADAERGNTKPIV